LTNFINTNKKIIIYPNPNDGSFTIDFGSDNYKEFNLKISDSEGQQLYFFDKFSSSPVTVNMSNKPKGAYILSLFNKNNMSVIIHKIIIQ